MGAKVLIVEDERSLLETLRYNLTREGYEVFTATDGVAALEAARREQPECIVLDIMLPELDGLEVCRILRRETNVPILMLTARTDEADRVVGLEVGAHDLPRFSRRLCRVGRAWSSRGRGQGLAVAKRIMEARAGRIGVESEVGRSSTLRAVMPTWSWSRQR